MAAPLTPPQAFDLAAAAADGFESPTSQPHPLLPQPVPGPRLIDTKAIGKLRGFSGKDEDWPAWVFVARGYVHLLDRAYRGMLEAAENAASQNELSMIDMSDTAQELSTLQPAHPERRRQSSPDPGERGGPEWVPSLEGTM